MKLAPKHLIYLKLLGIFFFYFFINPAYTQSTYKDYDWTFDSALAYINRAYTLDEEGKKIPFFERTEFFFVEENPCAINIWKADECDEDEKCGRHRFNAEESVINLSQVKIEFSEGELHTINDSQIVFKSKDKKYYVGYSRHLVPSYKGKFFDEEICWYDFRNTNQYEWEKLKSALLYLILSCQEF